MKKIILIVLSFILLLTGCNKNKIPNELLGKYVQDSDNKYGCYKGYAILSKKGSEYCIEMYSDSFLSGNEKFETSVLNAKGNIKEINLKEKLPIGTGWHGKDFYAIKFENIKILKSEKNNFKFDPNIYIIGTYELNQENYSDENLYKRYFNFTKDPISILRIGTLKFKKVK